MSDTAKPVLTREVPLVPAQSALLFIDVQNFSAKRHGAEFKDMPEEELAAKYGWFFAELNNRVIPNMQKLQAGWNTYTLGGPEYFGAAFEALGGKIVGTSNYSLNQPDFSAIVTTIKAADPAPDVIVTWAWEPDFPAFIKVLRGAGVTTQVMGGDVLDTPTVRGLGDVVDGVLHTSGGFPEEGSAYAAFIEEFTAATGTTPDNNYYVNGCDIAHMIEQAVAAAGSTEPAAVVAAMAGIENGKGVMSDFTFKGTDRMPLREVVVARITGDGQKGSFCALRPIPQPCRNHKADRGWNLHYADVRIMPM